jgi:uncharacterized membrane protein
MRAGIASQGGAKRFLRGISCVRAARSGRRPLARRPAPKGEGWKLGAALSAVAGLLAATFACVHELADFLRPDDYQTMGRKNPGN